MTDDLEETLSNLTPDLRYTLLNDLMEEILENHPERVQDQEGQTLTIRWRDPCSGE